MPPDFALRRSSPDGEQRNNRRSGARTHISWRHVVRSPGGIVALPACPPTWFLVRARCLYVTFAHPRFRSAWTPHRLVPPASVQAQRFSCLGAIQTWPVPLGVTALTIEAMGAQGGEGKGADGGLGAHVKGRLLGGAGWGWLACTGAKRLSRPAGRVRGRREGWSASSAKHVGEQKAKPYCQVFSLAELMSIPTHKQGCKRDHPWHCTHAGVASASPLTHCRPSCVLSPPSFCIPCSPSCAGGAVQATSWCRPASACRSLSAGAGARIPCSRSTAAARLVAVAVASSSRRSGWGMITGGGGMEGGGGEERRGDMSERSSGQASELTMPAGPAYFYRLCIGAWEGKRPREEERREKVEKPPVGWRSFLG